MPVFNEYVTHGKEVTSFSNAVPYISDNDSLRVSKISRTYDAISSMQHANLNDFNKRMHELLLQSNDLVNEYTKIVMGDIDAVKNTNMFNPSGGAMEVTASRQAIFSIYTTLSERYSDQEIKKYLINDFYDISEDPEEIKRLLHLRLNYNKHMTNLLNEMININSSVLNLCNKNMPKTHSTMSYTDLVNHIKQNENKYVKNNGTFYDLRELGYGVAYLMVGGDTKLEQFTTIYKLLPTLMRYDVTVITHGKVSKLKFIANIKTLFNFYWGYINSEAMLKKIDIIGRNAFGEDFAISRPIGRSDLISFILMDLNAITDDKKKEMLEKFGEDKFNEYHDLVSKNPMYHSIIRNMKSSMKAKQKFNKNSEDALSHKKSKWICEPIKTEKGGPYTNVDELIAQCIREAEDNKKNYKMIGSKTDHIHIMTYICNPGHHKLPPEIENNRKVHVHYSTTTVLAESNDMINNINDTEQILIQACNEAGIDYYNENYLNECYKYINSIDEDVLLSELTVKDILNGAIDLAKKFLGAIVRFFQFLLEKLRAFFNWIRGIKTEEAQQNNKMDAVCITMENAKVIEMKNSDILDIKAKVEKSCASISKEVKRLSSKQTQIMNDIIKDLDKKSRVEGSI